MLGQMVFSRAGVRVLAGQCNVVKKWLSTRPFTLAFGVPNERPATYPWAGATIHSGEPISVETIRSAVHVFTMSMATTNSKLTEVFSLNEDGLTLAERIEHCRFRCFVVTRKPDHDLWPYDDRYEEASD